MVVLGGGRFLMSEVPLYPPRSMELPNFRADRKAPTFSGKIGSHTLVSSKTYLQLYSLAGDDTGGNTGVPRPSENAHLPRNPLGP